MEKELFWKIFLYTLGLIFISTTIILIARLSLIAAVILLFVATISSSFLSSYFVQTINRLSEAIYDISRGKFKPVMLKTTHTEFSRIEDAIREVQDKLSNMREALSGVQDKTSVILSSMIEGVIAVDGKNEIILINEAARKFLSVGAEEVVGRELIEVIRNPDINDIIRTALSGSEVSEKLIHVAGPDITLMVQAGPTSGGGAVAVMQDVTRLQKLESVRKEFVANVSHELKTPITAIKSSVETLLEGAVNDPSHNIEFLKKVNKNAERLAVLIDDILELSDLDSQRIPEAITPCLLQDVYEKALDIIADKAKAKRITVSADLHGENIKVQINEDQLLRVFLNLLDNAVKYNKDKGSVTVSSRDEGDLVRINVSDTGIGIEEKHLPRLFERFYTVDKARSRELGGTGLGLAIAKHIVELNGGKIWVSSKPGVGSTFSFTLKKA